jgi:hypothetical protein
LMTVVMRDVAEHSCLDACDDDRHVAVRGRASA